MILILRLGIGLSFLFNSGDRTGGSEGKREDDGWIFDCFSINNEDNPPSNPGWIFCALLSVVLHDTERLEVD